MDIDALRQKAKEKAENDTGDYPPWLELNKDEEFIGNISGVRPSPWDEDASLYEVTDAEFNETFTLRTHRALMSKVVAAKPNIGDFIYIKYLGMQKAKESSFKYNAYEVAVLSAEEVEEMVSNEAPKPTPKKTTSRSAPKKEVKQEDPDEKLKTTVGRMLEFSDGEFSLGEAVRILGTKGFDFDESSAIKELTRVGFVVEGGQIRNKK